MLSSAARNHGHRRVRRTMLVLVVVSAALTGGPAQASTATTASPNLTVRVDSSGTGSLLTAARTTALRSATLQSNPRILIIGTGVQRSLFPSDVQTAISGDVTDAHGYGTMAASTILQVAPGARIVSRLVRSFDSTWTLLDMNALSRALDWARANSSSFDAVLLAFPPNAGLDPIADVAGHYDYGKFGKGLAMVEEALLSVESPTDGPVSGIPADRALRDRIFANLNLRQRDAVERFVASTQAWRAVLKSLQSLDDAGIAVVAPSGDYTRKDGDAIVPLPTQTIFGVSAVPSVITVGASYGPDARISPMSGRGPTLSLGMKPDLVAPSDVMAMIPASAQLAWPDDSTRVPAQVLDWGKNTTPSTCPSLTRDYRCVLQGSSMVSASLVAASVAALVARNTPHVAGSRAAADDEVLKGIAVSAASGTQARTSDGSAAAPIWEQGAGALNGLASLDLSKTPVVLGNGDLGQVSWTEPRSRSLSIWSGGATVTSASAPVERFLGPDASGVAVSAPFTDANRFDATAAGDTLTLIANEARYQGGVYAGHVSLVTADGSTTRLPVSVVQDVPFDFHVDAAYNEFQSGGAGEGERVEDQTVALFPGLPANVGLIGEAFKSIAVPALNKTGGDPTNGLTIRYGTTQSQFRDSTLPSSEHGRGRIEAAPPGFWRVHLLSDNAVEAAQARGREESLGIGLGSSGPDAAYSPASNVLVAQPPCSTSGVRGPLGCSSRTGEVDPSSGLCVARNSQTQVAYNVYCGEIAFALPIAVVSRAVHLIEHDTDPAKSEWRTCGLNLPSNGSSVDLASVVDSARNCPGATSPTAWSFGTASPDCLGPAEKADHPSGIATDVDAVYSGLSAPGTPGRNLPVGVLTYDFKLPSLNTYTTAGLSLAYKAENAIVAVRFKTGNATTDDAANGLLVVDSPNVTVSPPIADGAGTRGSVYNEWAVMSANATSGQISIVVIPTAWSRPDLDPSKAIARVQLCDIALRVDTFAKTAWGAASARKQIASMTDRGLMSQVDRAKSRSRAAWNGSSFADVGSESESLRFAIQVPKNSTLDQSAAHHVRSPRGGPAYLDDARSMADGASVLPASYKQYDLRRGVTDASCTDSGVSADPSKTLQSETCRLWKQAASNNELLAEIAPSTLFNGRFHGVLALDEAALGRAAGDVNFQDAIGDDAGAADAAGHWARTSTGAWITRFPVSNFYDDELSPFSFSALGGLLNLQTSGSTPVLTLYASGPLGAHTISTALH